MRVRVGLVALALIVAESPEARAAAPLYDPVMLNIGINCQWQQSCEKRQLKALDAARRYIAAKHPPLAHIHLCNRNARRGAARLDWVGFNACIRNSRLAPAARKRGF